MLLIQDDLGPVPLAAVPWQSANSGPHSGLPYMAPLLQPVALEAEQPQKQQAGERAALGCSEARCQGQEAQRPEPERELWPARRVPWGRSGSFPNGRACEGGEMDGGQR